MNQTTGHEALHQPSVHRDAIRRWARAVVLVGDVLLVVGSVAMLAQSLGWVADALSPATFVAALVAFPCVLIGLFVLGLLRITIRSRLALVISAIAYIAVTLGLWAVATALLLPVAYPGVAIAAAALLVLEARTAQRSIPAVSGAKRRWSAVSIALISVAPLLAFAVVALFLNSRAEREIHLIPDGYVGPVLIVFGVKDAGLPEYERGARVYRIGADGTARTRLPSNPGIQRDRFFYADVATGTVRSEIKGRSYSTIHDDPRTMADPEVVVHGGGLGVTTVPGVHFYENGREVSSSDLPCAVRFQQYFVGRRSDIIHMSRHDVSAYLAEHRVGCGATAVSELQAVYSD